VVEQRQAGYDANVEAIKDALAHYSKEELLHIAATQIVNGKYAENAHQAEREQWARRTVKTLVELVPKMGRKVRKENSQNALDARYKDHPKQKIKIAVKAEWEARMDAVGKGRWFAAFSREMIKKYPVIVNPDTIEKKWIRKWQKSYIEKSK
jgi:hypothetical protein